MQVIQRGNARTAFKHKGLVSKAKLIARTTPSLRKKSQVIPVKQRSKTVQKIGSVEPLPKY
jgi:hypothetical protein